MSEAWKLSSQPNSTAQLSLAGLKIKLARLDPSGRLVPDPTLPVFLRVFRVRVISGFGLKNRVHDPKISGGFESGLRVGSNFARSTHTHRVFETYPHTHTHRVFRVCRVLFGYLYNSNPISFIIQIPIEKLPPSWKKDTTNSTAILKLLGAYTHPFHTQLSSLHDNSHSREREGERERVRYRGKSQLKPAKTLHPSPPSIATPNSKKCHFWEPS